MNPSERAASTWPTGTVLTPDRTVSQTNAAVYSINPSTARRKLLSVIDVGEAPSTSVTPRVWARPKEQNRMIKVSGVLRTTVTYAVPSQLSIGTGARRMAASSVPTINAPTADSTVNSTVVRNASKICPRYSAKISI